MNEAVSSPEGRVFHTLDALRGIAAIGVFMFHMTLAVTPMAAPGGYLAVDLFFMMSGTVLSHAYESRFQAGMGTVDFMRARLIRLYPLYLLGTLLGIAATAASLLGRNGQHWAPYSLLQAALLALAFIPSFSTEPVNQMFPLNIPCWSLFLELLVNLLFVIFWPLLTRRRLVAVCLLGGAAMIGAIALKGNLDQGSTSASMLVGLARAVFGFSMGLLIARRIRGAPSVQSNLAVMAIVAVVGVAIAGRPEGVLRGVWDAISVTVIFPVVVYASTRIDPGMRLRTIATFLGVTSYAIYVLHIPLSSLLNVISRLVGQRLPPPYLGVVWLIVLLLGCWLIDRFIDMPVRRQLSRTIPKMHPHRLR
jgi:peptidoglycan/LPS O-acetylase OafA/YrhL